MATDPTLVLDRADPAVRQGGKEPVTVDGQDR